MSVSKINSPQGLIANIFTISAQITEQQHLSNADTYDNIAGYEDRARLSAYTDLLVASATKIALSRDVISYIRDQVVSLKARYEDMTGNKIIT